MAQVDEKSRHKESHAAIDVSKPKPIFFTKHVNEWQVFMGIILLFDYLNNFLSDLIMK